MATPSRTRPTWTSSAASISTRAATSARRSCRAWSTAAPRARAPCRSRYDGAAPQPAPRSPPASAGRHHGLGGGGRGVALLRLDRVADALSRGETLLAGGVPIRLVKPDWARFAFPGRKPRPPNDRSRSMPTASMRCPWPKNDPLYVAYHDEEWGVPEYDDRALYEKLVLDGFQAGLSWITILRKRENFRRAFDGFVPEKIARYRPNKIERLMQDAGIVRNRAKIEGAVLSARAWLEVMEKGRGFSKLLWDFVDGGPKVNHFATRQVPAETAISRAISKELSQRGFKFCGPTIVYAFMQAVGMVNDHLITCHRHAECAKLARKAVRTSRQALSCAERDPRPAASRRRRAPGSACCRGGGSICSIPRRSTSRSKTSRTGWRAWRAGTGRPRRAHLFGRAALACWSRPWRGAARRGSIVAARLAVLLHDAPEYVIGDMISPFKAVIGDAYKAVERRLLAAIHLASACRRNRRRTLDALIKAADRARRLSRSHAARRLRSRRGAALFRPAAGIHRRDGARLSQALAGRDRAGALSGRFNKLVAATSSHTCAAGTCYLYSGATMAHRDCS